MKDKLINKYEHNPIIRGLMQLIPFGIGSAIDVSFMTTVSKIQEDRINTFFDELKNGKIELTDEIVQNVDFIHCYMITCNAVIRTNQKEKIKLFSRLFKTVISNEIIEDVNEYEEYLRSIDDLSVKEIIMLAIIYEHEKNNTNSLKSQMTYNIMDCLIEIEKKLSASIDDVLPIMYGLNRTGLFIFAIPSSDDYRPYSGRLTKKFYRLIEFIGDNFIKI